MRVMPHRAWTPCRRSIGMRPYRYGDRRPATGDRRPMPMPVGSVPKRPHVHLAIALTHGPMPPGPPRSHRPRCRSCPTERGHPVGGRQGCDPTAQGTHADAPIGSPPPPPPPPPQPTQPMQPMQPAQPVQPPRPTRPTRPTSVGSVPKRLHVHRAIALTHGPVPSGPTETASFDPGHALPNADTQPAVDRDATLPICVASP